MKLIVTRVSVLCLFMVALSGCTYEGPTRPPISVSTPTAATTTASPTSTPSPTEATSTTNPFTGWVELTPQAASGEGRVLMACSEAKTATYWLYNLKTKASIGLTLAKSPDCESTSILTPTASPTSSPSYNPTVMPTQNPHDKWVEVTPKNVDDRRTFVFCSVEDTGFYWLYDLNGDNPIGGAVMGQVIPRSPDCTG